MSSEKIQRRAVKAGIKASKKRQHLVSTDELLALRVQTLNAAPPIPLGLAGITLVALAWHGWPSDSNAIQALEILAGFFFILFGAFGIRRTLSQVLETADSIDIAGSILEIIGEAVSNIDL